MDLTDKWKFVVRNVNRLDLDNKYKITEVLILHDIEMKQIESGCYTHKNDLSEDIVDKIYDMINNMLNK